MKTMNKLKFYLQMLYFMILGFFIKELIHEDLFLFDFKFTILSFLKLVVITIIFLLLIDFIFKIVKKLYK